jgi:KUP system potassium uptake protein
VTIIVTLKYVLLVSASFGYMDEPDVPSALRLAAESGLESALDLDEASYFLSTIEL